MNHWPDYDRETLEIDTQQVWEVYDPWEAKLIAVFYTKKNAKLFKKAYLKRWKKSLK